MSKMKTKSKVERVIALAKRKRGTTLDEIAKRLKIGRVAASSLINDSRRRGAKVKFSDGVYRV